MSGPEHWRVLVIDDEENMRLVLSRTLAAEGYQVFLAANGREGLDVLNREVIDCILCDVRMPVMDGRHFLQECRAMGIRAPVIMLSAYGTVDSAVEAIKEGAFDYVFKPFKPDEVLLVIKKAEEHERLIAENQALRQAAANRPPTGIVARSRSMIELLQIVDRMARVKSPVLITGESGTGKELVARAIHNTGPRKDMPFVPVNCGAIPDKLLESELFGHIRGAFTDAIKDRPGLFREADRGTLFLDEISDLPGAMQVKLLRAIQFEEIRPVGAEGNIQVDVRIVAAAAKDLAHETKEERFREDLFYRLSVLPINIPPLRERPDDVIPLLDHFLVIYSARMGRPKQEVSPAVAEALIKYHWPGNVRELENLVDRMLVLSTSSRLETKDLPSYILKTENVEKTESLDDLDMKKGIRQLEARMIRKALDKSNGNRAEAARRLKISYPSLLSKIKSYMIE